MKEVKPNKSFLILGAVDIGSNAARILIKSVDKKDGKQHMKKLQFLRIPLRLGFDVFGKGEIGIMREKMLLRAMKIFRQLLLIYNVDDYRICATSAFRDARNGKKVLRYIKKETKMDIEIITGQEEARIIRDNYPGTGNLLYMDVGGGSTELSLVCEGQLVDSRSFNIGTIRMLDGKVTPEMLDEMRVQVRELTHGMDNIHIIGSVGNINKLYRLSPKVGRKKEELSLTALRNLYSKLSPLTPKERMERYDLRESRADVIVPAAQLFIIVGEETGCDKYIVPNVGLADGIINELASKH